MHGVYKESATNMVKRLLTSCDATDVHSACLNPRSGEGTTDRKVMECLDSGHFRGVVEQIVTQSLSHRGGVFLWAYGYTSDKKVQSAQNNSSIAAFHSLLLSISKFSLLCFVFISSVFTDAVNRCLFWLNDRKTRNPMQSVWIRCQIAKICPKFSREQLPLSVFPWSLQVEYMIQILIVGLDYRFGYNLFHPWTLLKKV